MNLRYEGTKAASGRNFNETIDNRFTKPYGIDRKIFIKQFLKTSQPQNSKLDTLKDDSRLKNITNYNYE